MNFKKSGRFFSGKSFSRVFGAPGCHPGTLIDFVNTTLAEKGPVKTKCKITEVYRTHSVVTGPMNFKKSRRFFFSGKSCSRDFGPPGFHPGTLIDPVNTALDSKISVETICMIWEGCRTHRVVTGPMNFKKRTFFFGKSCSRDYGAPGCHPSTLIYLANTALASKASVETICMFWEGWRTHRGVNGSPNFKKLGRFFGKSCSRVFGGPGCHPSTLFDFINTALAEKSPVTTKCMISEVYRTHSVVTGPMNFKKSGRFFGKSCSRVFGGPGCHPSTLFDFINTALAEKGSVKTECMIAEVYRTHLLSLVR